MDSIVKHIFQRVVVFNKPKTYLREMSGNLCKRVFVFLVAFALWGGAMPMMTEAAPSHSELSTKAIQILSVAETSNAAHGNCLTHKCTGSIICTQTLACDTSMSSWQLAEWGPEWFSTAVKRLTNRSFGPEPTPPIS